MVYKQLKQVNNFTSLITYNRIEPFLNILTLPYDFDSKEHKKELKEFNKKYKNEWWFEKPKK